MASQGQVTRYAEFVAEKREDLLKLWEEYEEVLKIDAVPFNSKAEKKILNAQYLKLKAEIKVEKDFQCKYTLPQDPDFLYEWTKHLLKKRVEALQNKLNEQVERHEQLSAYETELEEEKYLSDILQQLHRKLVKRLRRLSRFYLSSHPDSTLSRKSEKMFFKVLKEFIVELEDDSPAAYQSEEEVVFENESFPEEQIQFLLDSNVIETVNEDPLRYRLKRYME